MKRQLVRGVVLGVAVLAVVTLASACGSDESSDTQSSAATPAAAQEGPQPGDLVAATWTDGNLYLATVTAADGDSLTVEYADDGSSATLSAAEVREIPAATFSAGDRVLAVWSNGRFYGGEVQEVDGTSYVIAWDDGSSPSAVEAGKVIAD